MKTKRMSKNFKSVPCSAERGLVCHDIDTKEAVLCILIFWRVFYNCILNIFLVCCYTTVVVNKLQ